MSLQYFKDFTKAYTYFKVFQKNVPENLSKKCELLQNVHCCCSVTQSCPTFCDPRDSQGLQHARLPCPSTILRAFSNSCISSCWCQQTISSSVIPFSSCPLSFPASGSFPMSQLFASGGQTIRASASILPLNIQG